MSAVAENLVREAGRERPAYDPWLVGAIMTLLGFGLVMVYSASVAIAARATGNSAYFLMRDAVAIVLGVLAALVVLRLPVRLWERTGPYLLLAGIALLAAVLIPGIGSHVNGSSRWLHFGLINVQPSEFVKLFLVVYVAGYLVRRQEALRSFTHGILMISIVLAVIGMLLLQEPDLGTVVVACITVLLMLFLAGVRFWHFLVVVIAGLGGMVVLTLVSPYRFERVVGFLNPWSDPFNRGFQLVQALIAFGRGGWFGVGLGASAQKLHYLPAAYTDFLLAVIGEELGFIGVAAVIALFGVVIVRALVIARRAEGLGQIYNARLAQGLGLLIGVQALINMGVNMGLLPTKGLTLPFMSYGGSSIVVCCIAAGLLLRIERETHMHAWGDH